MKIADGWRKKTRDFNVYIMKQKTPITRDFIVAILKMNVKKHVTLMYRMQQKKVKKPAQ